MYINTEKRNLFKNPIILIGFLVIITVIISNIFGKFVIHYGHVWQFGSRLGLSFQHLDESIKPKDEKTVAFFGTSLFIYGIKRELLESQIYEQSNKKIHTLHFNYYGIVPSSLYEVTKTITNAAKKHGNKIISIMEIPFVNSTLTFYKKFDKQWDFRYIGQTLSWESLKFYLEREPELILRGLSSRLFYMGLSPLEIKEYFNFTYFDKYSEKESIRVRNKFYRTNNRTGIQSWNPETYGAWDFVTNEKNGEEFYKLYWGEQPPKARKKWPAHAKRLGVDRLEPYDEQFDYVYKIIKLLEKNSDQVFALVMPRNWGCNTPENNAIASKNVQERLKFFRTKTNVKIINHLENEYDHTHWVESIHLNTTGADRYTRRLAKTIAPLLKVDQEH